METNTNEAPSNAESNFSRNPVNKNNGSKKVVIVIALLISLISVFGIIFFGYKSYFSKSNSELQNVRKNASSPCDFEVLDDERNKNFNKNIVDIVETEHTSVKDEITDDDVKFGFFIPSVYSESEVPSLQSMEEMQKFLDLSEKVDNGTATEEMKTEFQKMMEKDKEDMEKREKYSNYLDSVEKGMNDQDMEIDVYSLKEKTGNGLNDIERMSRIPENGNLATQCLLSKFDNYNKKQKTLAFMWIAESGFSELSSEKLLNFAKSLTEKERKYYGYYIAKFDSQNFYELISKDLDKIMSADQPYIPIIQMGAIGNSLKSYLVEKINSTSDKKNLYNSLEVLHNLMPEGAEDGLINFAKSNADISERRFAEFLLLKYSVRGSSVAKEFIKSLPKQEKEEMEKMLSKDKEKFSITDYEENGISSDLKNNLDISAIELSTIIKNPNENKTKLIIGQIMKNSRIYKNQAKDLLKYATKNDADLLIKARNKVFYRGSDEMLYEIPMINAIISYLYIKG